MVEELKLPQSIFSATFIPLIDLTSLNLCPVCFQVMRLELKSVMRYRLADLESCEEYEKSANHT